MDATPPHSSPLWDESLLADPHSAGDKPQRVRRMFNAIARRYDLNNRLHSAFLDQHWRRQAVRAAGVRPGHVVVDAACGTGDLTLAFARAGAMQVIGVDFADEMLRLATAKCAPIHIARRACRFLCADVLALPLADRCADIVSIAFGIRNVADPAAALREFRRVLKCGGRLVMLEFGLPGNALLRRAYSWYFNNVLPLTASFISGDRTGAYRYLPQSVSTFLPPGRMKALIEECGFRRAAHRPLSLGICVLYTAEA